MKDYIKYLLQKVLGYDNYLYYFSLYTISRVNINQYEKEFGYFLNMLSADSVVLDIGANIGITTVPIARKCSKGKVFAFEPIPSNLKALKRVTQRYKLNHVSFFSEALGDTNGSVQMVLPVLKQNKMQGLSHVVEENNNDAWNKGDFFTVPLKRLDDIPEINAQPINAIKIDVEGFEYEVLKGATNLLQKDKPFIYCEVWDNEKRSRCFNFMKELGYTIKVFSGDTLIEYANTSETNFFFCYNN